MAELRRGGREGGNPINTVFVTNAVPLSAAGSAAWREWGRGGREPGGREGGREGGGSVGRGG